MMNLNSNEMLKDLFGAEQQMRLINRLRREIVSCDFFDYSSTNEMFLNIRDYMSRFYSAKYHLEDISYKNIIYSVGDISFNYSCSIYMVAGNQEQDLTLREIINAQLVP